MDGSGSTPTKPVSASRTGRKAEPSASDNCKMCSCCFKTQFGNFKTGWISSENMFVARLVLEKGETLSKLADPLINELFVVLDEGESFSTKVETALRLFRN